MKFELNSHVLIAHWVPGFLLVMVVYPVLLAGSSPLRSMACPGAQGGEAIATLAVAVAAFFAGEVLDASRDLLEHLWDLLGKPIEWDFLADACQSQRENLEAYWITYYFFDCNASLAILVLLLTRIFTGVSLLGGSLVAALVSIFVLVVLVLNAWFLRKEIAKLTGRWSKERQNTSPNQSGS